MNVGALGHLLEFLSKLLNLLAVKLVIAENVDNRSIGKTRQGPLQAVSPGADVAGQDHGIRRNRGRCEGLKLQVQVAENVKAHGNVNPSQLRRAKPAQIPAPYESGLIRTAE